MSDWTALVVAKCPVAGLAKTRLGADVGDLAAADLASAALLDTLDAAASAPRCVVALTGSMLIARGRTELVAALGHVTVVEQHGDGFAERLVGAHHDAGPGPVVQVGMDTPQVTPALLAEVAAGLDEHDAVLGPADDGGWWVLALRDPGDAEALRHVEMSTPSTYADTLTALQARGLDVGEAPVLTDVDTVVDAALVATQSPATRFAATWRHTTEVVA